MIIKVVLHSIDDWPFVVLELCEKKKESDICRCNLLCFSALPTGFPSEERMRKRRNWKTSRKPWKVSVMFQ